VRSGKSTEPAFEIFLTLKVLLSQYFIHQGQDMSTAATTRQQTETGSL